MKGGYIIQKGETVKVENLKDWAIFMECYERRLIFTEIGEAKISTVFLGLDHNFSEQGDPILWETMVFSEKLPDLHPGFWGGSMARYHTRTEAERGHLVMCDKVREFYPDEPVVDNFCPIGQLIQGRAARMQDLRLGWGG